MIAGIFNIRPPIKVARSPSPLAPPQIVWVNWDIQLGPRFSGSTYYGISDNVIIGGDTLVTLGAFGNGPGNIQYTTDLVTWTSVTTDAVSPSGNASDTNRLQYAMAVEGTTLYTQNIARQILYRDVSNLDSGWDVHDDSTGTGRPPIVFDRMMAVGTNLVGFNRLNDEIYRSTDNGLSWGVAFSSWRTKGIARMANGSVVIVGFDNKIATSTDGSTWTDRSIPSASGGGIDSTIQFSDVTVHPADGSVYALAKAYNNGDLNDSGGEGIGIWRSTDNGVTWEQAAWYDPTPFEGLTFNPTSQIVAGDVAGHFIALSPSGEPIMTTDGFANAEVKYYSNNQELPVQASGYKHSMAFMRVGTEPYWFAEGAIQGTNLQQLYILNSEAPYGNIA